MLVTLRRSVVAACLALFASAPAAARPLPQGGSGEVRTLYQEGERALSEGRYGDAEKVYMRLRQLQPGTAEIHARLGLVYFQQGRFSDALAPLQRALELKPGLPNLAALLAMSLSGIGRHEQALPGLEKAFHQTSDPALRRMAGLHLQRSYTDLHRDGEAVAVALELSRLHPDDPEVLYHSGRLFGNYAYLQTMRLARIAPESVWLHQAAGEASESQGHLDEAISRYRRVLALAPNRPGIHFRLGRVLLTRARDDASAEAQALKEFQLELQVDPTNADAAYEIGEMMRKTGQLDDAIGSFKRAVAAYPKFEEALVGLGRALLAAKQPEAALPHLQQAIALNPGGEVAFYQLAQAYRALGREADQQKALREFERLRDSNAAGRGAPLTQAPSSVTKQQIESPAGPP